MLVDLDYRKIFKFLSRIDDLIDEQNLMNKLLVKKKVIFFNDVICISKFAYKFVLWYWLQKFLILRQMTSSLLLRYPNKTN